MMKVEVHQFRMSDVEDPDLWAAQTLCEWEKSDKGKWIMDNTIEPTWNRYPDACNYGWKYTITAKMTDQQYTFYKLKYG